MFGTLENDSGGSCLLGVMVADIKNGYGQALRVVSFTGNMCGKKGSYAAQTARGQGSQVHMEIFHLERLGALMNLMLGRKKQIIKAIDVGILGLKTNAVVSENVT